MKIAKLMILFPLLFKLHLSLVFAISSQSQNLDWSSIDSKKWLDFNTWKKSLTLNSYYNPYIKKRETMGRVIKCVGKCLLYRDDGFSPVEHGSKIVEGDEIKTSENGHIWIYFNEGSLGRLAPNSSIFLREINFSNSQIFIHIRVNFGNFIYLNRSKDTYVEKKLRETDPIFLPLKPFLANNFNLKEQGFLNHYKKLNTLIKKNAISNRSTLTNLLLTTPHFTFNGINSNLEIYVIDFEKSFIKIIPKKLLGLTLDKSQNPNEKSLYLRGNSNSKKREISPGTWYSSLENGRNIKELTKNESNKLHFGQILISRIPSILIAREKMFEKYSYELLNNKYKFKNSYNDSYYKWSVKNNDIGKRIHYLIDNIRKIETLTLYSRKKFLQKRADIKLQLPKNKFNFHQQAITAYSLDKRQKNELKTKTNSTKKFYWKFINAY